MSTVSFGESFHHNLFLGKIRKKIITLSSAELAQAVVNFTSTVQANKELE